MRSQDRWSNWPCTTGDTGFAVRRNRTAKGDIRTAKPLPCVDARQIPHGEGLPGKGFFAVRLQQNARQRLCRAASASPSATSLCRASDVAVRRHHLPCEDLCRAPSLLTHGKGRLFAVRPTPHARQRTLQAHPGQQVALPLPCVCARQSLCRAHTHGKGPGIFHLIFVFY